MLGLIVFSLSTTFVSISEIIYRMKKLSENGQLFVCGSCRKIHLEFGNLAMDFQSKTKLRELLNFLNTVSANHFENEVLSNNSRRQILVPFANSSIKLLLSDVEIKELTALIRDFLQDSAMTGKASPPFTDLKKLSVLNLILLN